MASREGWECRDCHRTCLLLLSPLITFFLFFVKTWKWNYSTHMTIAGLSSCQPQRAIWFLYFSAAARQSNWAAESNIHLIPTMQKAPIEQHIYEIWTVSDGISVGKAQHEQRICCRNMQHSKNSPGKAVTDARANKSTQGQPCSCSALANEN